MVYPSMPEVVKTHPVNTIGIVAKKGKPEAMELAAELRRRYPTKTILAERYLCELLGWPIPTDDLELTARSDLLVVLGGDGTLIHAARLLGGRSVPILGVNLGSLGFMTEVPKSELFAALDETLAGRFTLDSRMKLSCRLWRQNQVILEDEVLNDLVINKGALARIADHETSVDGQYLTTYKSDGVIVSTPTGSTAYSLSAGGPIVHPAIDCAVITPICPHSLTQRPILIPGDRVIRITLKSEAADVYLTIDGQAGHALHTADMLEVQKSPNRVQLVKNPQLGYFAMLRQKLRWGER
jgi:NAD+ kinase